MATKAEQASASVARKNSVRKRAAAPKAHPTKPEILRAATAKSSRGRALHGRTKLQADAKAGKPDLGKTTGFFQSGPHGGEDQTFNGVPGTGRGSDGPASVAKTSRKSTRGSVAGGEKASSMTRGVRAAMNTPEKRAARATAKAGAKGRGKIR